MNRGPENSGQEPEAPARLAEALRALTPRRPSVPPTVDAAILAQARARLKAAGSEVGPEADLKVRVVLFPRLLALAATLVVGVGVVFLLQQQTGKGPAVAIREDIDRNGRVDILDAFALARKLQAGNVADTAFDLTGDGVVDQRDIDWIAARAVSLGMTAAGLQSSPAVATSERTARTEVSRPSEIEPSRTQDGRSAGMAREVPGSKVGKGRG